LWRPGVRSPLPPPKKNSALCTSCIHCIRVHIKTAQNGFRVRVSYGVARRCQRRRRDLYVILRLLLGVQIYIYIYIYIDDKI